MARARGFSLLELLTTLSIAAVVLAIGVPSMTALIERNRIAAAHNEFVAGIYLLRSEAVKRNRTMTMCRVERPDPPRCASGLDSGWEAGWAIWHDEDGNQQIDDGEALIAVRNALPRGVRLTGNGTTLPHRIAYRSTGVPAGFNNGTFTVCLEGRTERRQIIISSAGRIRSQVIRDAPRC